MSELTSNIEQYPEGYVVRTPAELGIENARTALTNMLNNRHGFQAYFFLESKLHSAQHDAFCEELGIPADIAESRRFPFGCASAILARTVLYFDNGDVEPDIMAVEYVSHADNNIDTDKSLK